MGDHTPKEEWVPSFWGFFDHFSGQTKLNSQLERGMRLQYSHGYIRSTPRTPSQTAPRRIYYKTGTCCMMQEGNKLPPAVCSWMIFTSL